MQYPKLTAYTLANGVLTHNPNIETGADRMGAMAWGSRMGSLLWHYTWALDDRAGRDAKKLLKATVLGDKSDVVIARICEIVVDEWSMTKCFTCYGRGYSVMDGTPIAKAACKSCNGSGTLRHSDAERKRHLGRYAKLYAKIEHQFGRIHGILSNADYWIYRVSKQQLERNH